MAICVCCNGELPASSIVDELCPECTEAMEARLDYAPERFTQPIPVKYPVTRILVLINFGICALCIVLRLLGMQELVARGIDWGPTTLGGQWWRMFTAMFLHVDLAHLLGNMWWLWVVGKMTEQIFTRWTFLSLYLLTGLVGEVVSLSVHPELGSLGASGAIFGITGVAIAAFWQGELPSSALRFSWRIWPLMIFTALSLLGGATNQDVGNAAHVGGLVSGLLLGVLLSRRFGHADAERIKRFERRVFAVMCVFVVLGVISLRLYYSDILPLGAAQQAIDAGKLEEAARIAEGVTAKRPTDVQAHLFLGDVYIRAGDYDRAEDLFNRALKLDPDNSDARRLRLEARFHRR